MLSLAMKRKHGSQHASSMACAVHATSTWRSMWHGEELLWVGRQEISHGGHRAKRQGGVLSRKHGADESEPWSNTGFRHAGMLCVHGVETRNTSRKPRAGLSVGRWFGISYFSVAGCVGQDLQVEGLENGCRHTRKAMAAMPCGYERKVQVLEACRGAICQ